MLATCNTLAIWPLCSKKPQCNSFKQLKKASTIAAIAAIAALASRPAGSIPKRPRHIRTAHFAPERLLGIAQTTATLAPLSSLFGFGDRDRSRDPTDDCFECRVIGTTTCVGVAAYCLHAAKTTPAQRVWLTCFGGAWAVLGAIRAVV